MVYAVGDIHGCVQPLRRLIDLINPSKNDTLIFLGDYIDRGPDSRAVVNFLLGLSHDHHCVFLRGNHEGMMIDAVVHGNNLTLWYFNGARATVESYGGINNIPQRHLEFILNTKFYYEEDDFLFVHAGVKPGIPLAEQDPFDMLWIRDEFIYSSWPLNGRRVVFGHTPFLEEPLIMEDKIGIDTGCVYGGKLSAVRVDDLRVFSVPCHESTF
ncbi:MAG: serine/threonine protein phosphatase [Thermotogae bacterium]|nr:serine/threonine protein phosphatase [Thermotogota bacterium]RKX46240.1 MAG: serine/threonine protein phosphatase [Thermotogota bacterium]